jgi:hypothetical protein
VTSDDASLIELLLNWGERKSQELRPIEAHHIAGHITAMNAENRFLREALSAARKALGEGE